MIKKTSIFCIRMYQKFISPKKGYRCAHSVLHGDTGCSGAVISIINENSIFKWKGLIKQRFSDCKNANVMIKEKNKNKKKGKCNKCDNCLDGLDCDIFDGCDGCLP